MRLPSFASLRTSIRRLLGRPSDTPSETPSESPEKQPPSSVVSREVVEMLVGIPVGDLTIYEQALRHRSCLRGRADSHLYSNERLEFLGDAVLGFVVAEYLYHHFPDKTEGFMTRLRAKLVNGQALAEYARDIDLGEAVLLSENMEQTDGRTNQTILADAFEALIGALYLDQGLEPARRFIHRTMLDDVDLRDLAEQHDNYKSLLLEYVQARDWAQPTYRVVHAEGPSHDRTFTVEVLVRDEAYGDGRAGSKKRAEQKAARQALKRLRAEEKS